MFCCPRCSDSFNQYADLKHHFNDDDCAPPMPALTSVSPAISTTEHNLADGAHATTENHGAASPQNTTLDDFGKCCSTPF
jgi:hypothetical protein